MRVGVLQFAPVFGDTKTNLDRIDFMLQGAVFDLLVLPELCTTGYQFLDRAEALALAEDAPDGPACRRVTEMAARGGGAIVFSMAERAADGLFISALVAAAEGVTGVYRKVHLFGGEKRIFDPGPGPFRVFPVRDARVGVSICFDWAFPESARSLALAGADIIAHPANLVLPFCQQAMITRAIENGVFTIVCNRTGFEERGGKPRLTFTGHSRIAGPRGEVLLGMGPDEEGVRVVEIDTARARDKRITPDNDLLLDRRPDIYRL